MTDLQKEHSSWAGEGEREAAEFKELNAQTVVQRQAGKDEHHQEFPRW